MFNIRPYRKGDCIGFKIRDKYETGTDAELDEAFIGRNGTSIITENGTCIGAISYGIYGTIEDCGAYVFCAFRDTPTRELIVFVKEMLRIATTTSPLNFYAMGIDTKEEERFLHWLGFEKTAEKDENNYYKYKFIGG